ncbi:MAG: sulfotransferase [Frankiales bacterium]|nr:sulfotransferase [Frankiales bacterium]
MPVEPVLQSAYEVYIRAKARGNDPTAGPAFNPTASPLHGRVVFVLGAPRSGTTWLHQLLMLHPQVATAGESHIFCEGIGPLLDNHASEDPYFNLSGWLTRPELVTLMRELVDGVFGRLRETIRPEATHVLDKTPNHIPYAAQAAEVYPDATYIQIIRDGRDSAASAHNLWSWSSTYRDHLANAARWREAVLDCREHLSGLNYVELRYEDLLADTPRELARALDAIGLPYDDNYLTSVADFGKTPVNLRPSMPDVRARKWERISGDIERDILVAAGDLLVDLGYVTAEHRDRVLAQRSVRRTAVEGRDLARKAVGRARRNARRVTRRPTDVQRRGVIRRRARGLAEAISAGNTADAAQNLGAKVALLDGDDRVEGRDTVADHLVTQLTGCRLLVLEADEVAATMRWSDGGARQFLHQVFLDSEGLVERIVVVGRGSGAR